MYLCFHSHSHCIRTTSSIGQLCAEEEGLWVNWTGLGTTKWESWAGREKKGDGEGGGNNLGYVCVLSIPSSPG